MKIECVWEHNGKDTLLHAINLPGAYTRGENLQIALDKMPHEVESYMRWRGKTAPHSMMTEIVQDVASALQILDADADVLFAEEGKPLALEEYLELKALVLKSASDFLTLYESVPNKDRSDMPLRKSFYGLVPRTASEMYVHTKNVNAYYFGEIGVEADNEGTI